MKTVLLLLALISFALCGKYKDHPVEKYLYVWVGGGCAFPDSTNCDSDYIATVDVNHKSTTYNQVLDRAYLPDYIAGTYGNTDYYAKANEAHHMYMTSSNYIVAAARAAGNSRTNPTTGTLYPGKADVFIFELDPATKFPVFKFAIDPPGSCSDEITPINDDETQFLVAHLCKSGNSGWAGGAISLIDIATRASSNWMVNPPVIAATSNTDYVKGTLIFNPHSGDYDPNYGYVATNFVIPGTRRYGISLSYFDPNGNYKQEITYTGDSTTDWANFINTAFNNAAPSSGSGFMDIKYIDDYGNLVTCASLQGKLYHINVDANPPTARMALDVAGQINNGERTFSATTIRVIHGANRIVATYGLRYVVLVDWDKDYNFSILDSFDTCTVLTCTPAAASTGVQNGNYSGAHYVKLSDDYETVYVSTYYQSYPGNKRILAFKLDEGFNTLTLDTGLDRGTTALLNPHIP